MLIERINYLAKEVASIIEVLNDGVEYDPIFTAELVSLECQYQAELTNLKKEAAKIGYIAI